MFLRDEIDETFCDPAVQSKVLARWERKALLAENNKQVAKKSSGTTKEEMVNDNLLQNSIEGNYSNSKVLAFKNKAPEFHQSLESSLKVLYTQNKVKAKRPTKKYRNISSTPERILDAPDILDDFYLNLLDWSCNDFLAICLGSSLYLWDTATGDIDLLFEADNHGILTSVKWSLDGLNLAIGTTDNVVTLWDVSKRFKIRSMKGHSDRVGSLAWNHHVLATGSRDAMIFQHDVRIKNHHFLTLDTHEQEICGLQWSSNGTQLASGGNDNTCCIWNAKSSTPCHTFTESMAAVRALSWCPFQENLLATGGATMDGHIRFYNTLTGELQQSFDTKSQICSLVWSKHEKELVSSHGFSQNQLSVWKYPTMMKVADLIGHSSRVLYTSLSPDGTTVCSAAGDGTFRFWKIWDQPTKSKLKHRKPTKSCRSIR